MKLREIEKHETEAVQWYVVAWKAGGEREGEAT
jgi:hypothetical protein